jgi:hypothetical protein
MAGTNPFEDIEARLERLEQKQEEILAIVKEAPKADPWPELLTRQQAADFLSVAVQTIDSYTRQGLLNKIYIGTGSPRFRRDDLRALSEKGWEKGKHRL